MSQQSLSLKIKGLYSFPNELSEVPEGALLRADNCVIDAEGKIRSRRGFGLFGDFFGGSEDRADSGTTYKGRLLINYSNKLAYDANGAGDWTEYSGSFFPPTNKKMRFIEANSSLFFTTSNGVFKLETLTSTPRKAGAPKALELDATLASASGGFLPDGDATAYVVLWGRKDANGVLQLGVPSARAEVMNGSGNSKDIDLEFSIPQEVVAGDFYQLYRAKAVTNATPSADYYLVLEAKPSSGQMAARKVTLTDVLPETLNRGVPIYTSRAREGIAEANEQPPFAEDIATFKGMTFYANIRRKQQLFVSLLSEELTDGAVLTIGGITYTADDAAEYIPTSIMDSTPAKFKIETGGGPGTNIEATAKSLVRVVNRNPHSTVYAFYTSGFADLPGQMMFEARELSQAAFTVGASTDGDLFSPDITTPVSSANEERKNGLYWSKLQEPEAVPLKNYQPIGSADKAILRILALRDSLFIFKEDGTYKLTGSDPNSITIVLSDNTTRLIAPESAVVGNNQVYMMSDQGVATVSDGGVGVLSRPIENSLQAISSDNAAWFSRKTHAVFYETERKYILFTLNAVTDTESTCAFVYNTFTQAWTRWTFGASWAHIHDANNRLYLGDGARNTLREERKSFNNQDYSDEVFNRVILDWDADTKILTLNSVSGLLPGMVVTQNNKESKIEAVNGVDNELTMVTPLDWEIFDEIEETTGECSVYSLIDCFVQWTAQHAANPIVKKQFREAQLLMTETRFADALMGFATDLNIPVVENMVYGQVGTKWGQFPWGQEPWGGNKGRKPIRTLVPMNYQRARWLYVSFRHSAAFEQWEIAGISLFYSVMSERTTGR